MATWVPIETAGVPYLLTVSDDFTAHLAGDLTFSGVSVEWSGLDPVAYCTFPNFAGPEVPMRVIFEITSGSYSGFPGQVYLYKGSGGVPINDPVYLPFSVVEGVITTGEFSVTPYDPVASVEASITPGVTTTAASGRIRIELFTDPPPPSEACFWLAASMVGVTEDCTP